MEAKWEKDITYPKKYNKINMFELDAIVKEAQFRYAKADHELTQFTLKNYKERKQLTRGLKTVQRKDAANIIADVLLDQERLGVNRINEIAKNAIAERELLR